MSPSVRPPSGEGPVVFFHAHPDDEAIFTGGTVRLLADAGVACLVVFATSGEGGEEAAGAGRPADLGALRRDECRRAATALGLPEPIFLGHRDSGLDPVAPDGSLAATAVHEVAAPLADLLRDLSAAAVVTYDAHGIYGHPDHVAVHRAGLVAADLAGTPTRYLSTVDREHLHFVETHLVEEARVAVRGVDALPGFADGSPDATTESGEGPLGLAASGFGTPTVMVDLVVDVRSVLGAKRTAMAAHASQIPPTSSAMRLGEAGFADVYGVEWYLRHGPPGALDRLPRR